jgi:hypothetical protein
MIASFFDQIIIEAALRQVIEFGINVYLNFKEAAYSGEILQCKSYIALKMIGKL